MINLGIAKGAIVPIGADDEPIDHSRSSDLINRVGDSRIDYVQVLAVKASPAIAAFGCKFASGCYNERAMPAQCTEFLGPNKFNV